jgi:hypothetical protein
MPIPRVTCLRGFEGETPPAGRCLAAEEAAGLLPWRRKTSIVSRVLGRGMVVLRKTIGPGAGYFKPHHR